MNELMMSSELDDEMGDFDAGASTNSDNDKVDSVLIKKILCEMKSEFNRGMCSLPYGRVYKDDEDQLLAESLSSSLDTKYPVENGQVDEKLPISKDDEKVESFVESKNEVHSSTDEINPSSSNNSLVFGDDKENEINEEKVDLKMNGVVDEEPSEEIEPPKKKQRLSKEILVTMDTKSADVPPPVQTTGKKRGRKPLPKNIVREEIVKPEPEVNLKRSSRRMSKEFSHESVLQNAIARKEKSFSSLSVGRHRRSTRLTDTDKPTPKGRASVRNTLRASIDSDVSTPSKATNDSFKGYNGKTPKTSLSELTTGTTTIGSELKKVSRLFDTASIKSNSLPPSEPASEDELINYQAENDWEKATDSSSNISSFSFKSKKNKYSFSKDNFQPQSKHSRTNSPTVPEACEAPRSESDIPTMHAYLGGNCECLTEPYLYPSKGSITASMKYCRALDTFESRIIGCCNEIDENTPLLRPSKAVPLLLMCDVHVERLKRHNCCPSCGLFCTQGNVYQCTNYHFFHKECELKKEDLFLCPHCSTEDFLEVKLTLQTFQYPVFLPMQKASNKHSHARISFSQISFWELDEKDESDVKDLVPAGDLFFNKKKISTDGIPSVEKEKLGNLMHAMSSRNEIALRFSQRAFYQACKNGDAEKLLLMLNTTNFSVKESASAMGLHAAAGNGHLAVVHILVQAGCSLEALDKNQYTALMLAATNGHNAVVKYLVKAGAEVTFKGNDGMTALHLAAKNGNLEACHYLLSSANTPLSYVDCLDDGLWTPLVWAAENKHAAVVRYLLEKKADPQLRDSEMNIALHWSAFSGSMEITEDLLNYGSAVNSCNAHGDTPLHIAARQAADNCVMLLLARGARTNIANKAGQLPKDCILVDSAYCKTAIELNMKIKSALPGPLQYPRILSNDISRGKETNPIQCVNEVDDMPKPKGFVYVSENCITSNLSIDRRITTMTGCRCEDMCTTAGCACSRISLRCWYDNRGKLLPEFNFKDPPMIFECNQSCECNAITCKNRVVQRGMKAKLQVCRTKHKDWGVITLKEIPKGTYVCEYVGEIISDCEADTREDDSYLFDLDNRDGESYCIDACKYGNVTRFVNHSCKPNLIPVRVFISHHDLHFPRIAFFAARDIAPNEELGFDYGEKFWIIKYKNFTCACEEEGCRYSADTIHDTLEKYKERVRLEESS